jgi:Ran GTPase-activating protein (RanGAP) involved in mRNA processing and transport
VRSDLIPLYLDGNTTREVTKANYIDVLSKALADDVALVQKIQNKGFKFKELDDIVDEYKQESTHYKGE